MSVFQEKVWFAWECRLVACVRLLIFIGVNPTNCALYDALEFSSELLSIVPVIISVLRAWKHR